MRGDDKYYFFRKDFDYEEIEEPNGFEEMQPYELLLDGCNVVVASIYRRPSSCSENNDQLSSILIEIGDARTRYIVFGDKLP